MPKCPACQTELNDDFGFVKCPGCGVMCSIDIEDNVTLLSDEMLDIETQDAESSSYDLEEEGEGEEISDHATEEELLAQADGLAEDNSSVTEGMTEEESYYETVGSEEELEDHTVGAQDIEEENLEYNLELQPGEEDQDIEEEGLNEYSAEGENLENYSAASNESLANDLETEGETEAEEEDGEVEVSTPMSAEEFQSEIELFGDMSSEAFQAGSYFFDITVSGIDTRDIRFEVLEALKDDRLKLETEDLSRRIRDGILILHQIPAVKAFIIIQTLSHLNCELDWRLKEVQDLESAPALDESEYQEQQLSDEDSEIAEDDFLGDLDSSEESEF